jgi:hypothetical protein
MILERHKVRRSAQVIAVNFRGAVSRYIHKKISLAGNRPPATVSGE